MQTLDETTTVIDLEQLVNGDDCTCEARHHEETTCSVEVTHRYLAACESRDARVCENVAVTCVRWQRLGYNCASCRQPASECWTVIPI